MSKAKATVNLGSRIRFIRKARQLTQEMLAERLGIEPTSMSRIETNKHKPSLDTLEDLAVALDVPVYAFLTDEVAMTDEQITPEAIRYKLYTYIATADDATLLRWYRDTL
ncbi:hypothetical protein GCM10009007_12180 [Formosimonas limnophila]|uniref:HTH cro/C1-type domain-containing protein n=1 Tax=Formosimonas limnophila TaxID=1384487 RepID=A0A8J3G0M7_9BURK|nr:helix-turn-helix transcriptional regulator [Formosimonas limnophila]GHA72718.1 hypothetical protein GCM10009007_12180 [Formosimonas limnophila]